jgi:hypothetical protein
MMLKKIEQIIRQVMDNRDMVMHVVIPAESPENHTRYVAAVKSRAWDIQAKMKEAEQERVVHQTCNMH